MAWKLKTTIYLVVIGLQRKIECNATNFLHLQQLFLDSIHWTILIFIICLNYYKLVGWSRENSLTRINELMNSYILIFDFVICSDHFMKIVKCAQ